MSMEIYQDESYKLSPKTNMLSFTDKILMKFKFYEFYKEREIELWDRKHEGQLEHASINYVNIKEQLAKEKKRCNIPQPNTLV